MKLKLWAATTGALLAMPACALAQPSPDPTDPHAAVPTVAYESVITDTARPEPDSSEARPDKLWRRANDTVADAGGHAGHGAGAAAGGDAHAGHAPAAQAAPAPAATPAHQPAADHSKHH